jgi:hypothetical protein
MSGPVPKPASKRRRRNVPVSYGAAEPTTAPAAPPVDGGSLGIDNPHPLIASLWNTVQTSCESAFFSPADWERLRFELWYANQAMHSPRPISGHTWAAIQHGLTELLVSPAAKRRVAIEVKAPGPDTDEVRAVAMIGTYKSKLKPV